MSEPIREQVEWILNTVAERARWVRSDVDAILALVRETPGPECDDETCTMPECPREPRLTTAQWKDRALLAEVRVRVLEEALRAVWDEGTKISYYKERDRWMQIMAKIQHVMPVEEQRAALTNSQQSTEPDETGHPAELSDPWWACEGPGPTPEARKELRAYAEWLKLPKPKLEFKEWRQQSTEGAQ